MGQNSVIVEGNVDAPPSEDSFLKPYMNRQLLLLLLLWLVNPPVASGQISAELQRLFDYDLVVEGDKTNVPLDATEAWARWLPNAHLLLIPNAGHMNWLDQPEAVITSMNEFFRGRRLRDAKGLTR